RPGALRTSPGRAAVVQLVAAAAAAQGHDGLPTHGAGASTTGRPGSADEVRQPGRHRTHSP
ncbi:hypothetical protein, partial [Streptomyces sp. NPDC002346]